RFQRGLTGQAKTIVQTTAEQSPTIINEGVFSVNNRIARKHSANQASGGVHKKLATSMSRTPSKLPSKFSPYAGNLLRRSISRPHSWPTGMKVKAVIRKTIASNPYSKSICDKLPTP